MKAWTNDGPRIVVTGATGATGQHVARALEGEGQVRLVVRDADKARRMGLPGDVVVGDYGDPAGLKEVLAGADAVYVVTANPLRPRQDADILDAARAGGVGRAVKISWVAVADPDADDLVARWCRESEALLRGSGLDWTVLRLRSPMSNTLSWARSIREEGVVRGLGGDARTACVDPRDVAEIARRALVEEGHAGKTYALTGPELLSPREQTQHLARLLQRTLEFQELTPDQALERWRARVPEAVAQALLEGAERRADGASAQAEDDCARLLGRTPTTYAAWAADHIESFR
ncbi:NAD(P)H-binding protein [Streptomyces sp. NPDC050658]|uniref:NAD(P)H-binding protein n=1 Tax=unclassified Streptomyces TaxID=2593676 RepID=UPI003430706C